MKIKEIEQKHSEKLYLDLVEIRHKQGLYKIEELADMFSIGREQISYAINTGRLRYMSPNNKTRFVYLNDFIEYLNKKDTYV
ncbi:MAG: hypothetical protein IJZ29_04355 [Clostridia bacterium]|nr:hypothetical protein [Clostridia bacterium]